MRARTPEMLPGAAGRAVPACGNGCKTAVGLKANQRRFFIIRYVSLNITDLSEKVEGTWIYQHKL